MIARSSRRSVPGAWTVVAALGAVACSSGAPGLPGDGHVPDATAADVDANANVFGDDGDSFSSSDASAFDGCRAGCSDDFLNVLDCAGAVVSHCAGSQACDAKLGACADSCVAAQDDHRSVGCEYYATFMDEPLATACFAAFVTNTWSVPAHLRVQYQGNDLQASAFVRLPVGTGPSLTYQPFDEQAGIAPGQVAILFLSGPVAVAGEPPGAQCPIPSAVPSGVLMQQTTGIGDSFRIATDVPVVAYQINPYGGGGAQVTGASLLLPTSVWDTNYVAVNAAPYDIAPPSLNIVAMSDSTTVTVAPVADVAAGSGVEATPAGALLTLHLNKGQQAQISQNGELTGSAIQSDRPVGLMSGHQCMRWPQKVAACDHGEQMIPPVKAMGSRYVGVPYRARLPSETTTTWRIVGAVDDTRLAWSPNAGGPPSVQAGQSVAFSAPGPFVVTSQDQDHPFLLFEIMTGCHAINDPASGCYGDPDFVLDVPPEQYLSHYVFFTDPTYPETNLVIVRTKGLDGAFHDVTLDCAGTIGGWQQVGEYEWARTDLSTGDFKPIGQCANGAHQMASAAPFGLWVWGWGTPLTTPTTEAVSYGYPGGMDVRPINHVQLIPTPR